MSRSEEWSRYVRSFSIVPPYTAQNAKSFNNPGVVFESMHSINIDIFVRYIWHLPCPGTLLFASSDNCFHPYLPRKVRHVYILLQRDLLQLVSFVCFQCHSRRTSNDFPRPLDKCSFAKYLITRD